MEFFESIMSNGFGMLRKEENLYHRLYQDKYVTIQLNGVGSNYNGRFDRIENGHIILDPHQGRVWDNEGNSKRTLIDGPEVIRESLVASITPISQENLVNFLRWLDKKEEKQNGDASKNQPTN